MSTNLIGRLVRRVDDDAPVPATGEIQDVESYDDERVHVAWGHENRAAGITTPEFLDELTPVRRLSTYPGEKYDLGISMGRPA